MKNNERIGVLELLDAYRKTLEPGIYFFCGKWYEGSLVGIEEVVDHYRSEELGKKNGVTFAYYPGEPGVLNILPFCPSIGQTAKIFQMAFAKHLAEKLQARGCELSSGETE